jgi:hypothetical protein
VLLAIVLALVYGAFAQISGPALAQRDRLTEQQELRLLLRMIADDVQAAQWLARFREKSDQSRTGIVAETRPEGSTRFTRISFHAARPARFHRTVEPLRDPELHEIGYFVTLSEDRSQLVLKRREDFYLDDDLEEGGVEVELADHIQQFLIEFQPPGADPDALQPDWEDRWNSPNQPEAARMPLAVRITLERTDASGRPLGESIELNLPMSLK